MEIVLGTVLSPMGQLKAGHVQSPRGCPGESRQRLLTLLLDQQLSPRHWVTSII